MMVAAHGALQALYEAERERLAAYAAAGAADGVFHQPVFADGPVPPKLMLIGEAPGAQEVLEGRAFVGKAGRELEELLQLAGINRADVFVTNAVKYRPITPSAHGARNRTPRTAEITASLPLLRKELNVLRPQLVATVGNIPLLAMLSLAGQPRCSIGDVHGRMLRLQVDGHSLQLFPLYHPASIIYNRSLRPVCEQDAIELGRLFHAGAS